MPHIILVEVDSNGKFTYINYQTGKPLIRDLLRLKRGSLLSWLVRLNGETVPYQVSFPNFSPFGPRRAIRCTGGLSVPVEVKTGISGLGMKYTVSLANGWSDDPEILVDNDLSPLLVGTRCPEAILAIDVTVTLGSKIQFDFKKPDVIYEHDVLIWNCHTPEGDPLKFTIARSDPWLLIGDSDVDGNGESSAREVRELREGESGEFPYTLQLRTAAGKAEDKLYIKRCTALGELV
jgi:hypothetical protein